jgi:cytochrome c oxidase assembly factor CtaG
MGILASPLLEPPVTLGLILTGAVYVHAEGRVRRARGGRRVTGRRRWYFLAGLVAIFAALESPIDTGAETSFSIHMIQHLLLTMVSAPLLVLGAPVTLALQAWPGIARRRILWFLRSAPIRLLTNPLVAWALFFGVMWASHLTGLYEATLRSDGIHSAEHLAYLATALLFWMPVVGVDPAPSHLSYPARILYLFLAMPAMAFLGLAIFSARHVLYPAYAAVEGTARALADQRVAGALMWNGGMFLIVPALAFVLLDWMRADEREARRVDERLLRSAAGLGEGSGS